MYKLIRPLREDAMLLILVQNKQASLSFPEFNGSVMQYFLRPREQEILCCFQVQMAKELQMLHVLRKAKTKKKSMQLAGLICISRYPETFSRIATFCQEQMSLDFFGQNASCSPEGLSFGIRCLP